MKRLLTTIMIGFFLLITLNQASADMSAMPLKADEAFQLSTQLIDKKTIAAHFKIAPGHLLYQEAFNFSVKEPNKVTLGKPTLPPSITKHDDIMGEQHVYKNDVKILVPILKTNSNHIELQVSYQGCSEAGFCYPPVSKQITLDLTQAPVQTNAVTSGAADRLLASNNLWLILTSFLGFGLLLSFTPCVFPMIPILSGIIAGSQKPLTTQKAFGFSLAYVLSMAVTYAAAGMLAGIAGSHLQATLQNPWVIATFSAIFVLLAMSMFGLYELRLPSALQQYFSGLSDRRTGGGYVSAAIMGCLSTLIVSPCVTAPLAGALGFISKTGDPWLGGSALLAMGLGMGIPLLIVGTSLGRLLPRAGGWMDAVKTIFGFLMLGIAIWMLERVIPGPISLILWAVLLSACAVYLGAFKTATASLRSKLQKGFGIALFCYGIVLAVGAVQGNSNPLQPLANLPSQHTHAQPQGFKTVKTSAELNQVLAEARQQNKVALIDFYADWCTSCKKIDRTVFANPDVQKNLQPLALLRIDVTSNDAASKQLLEELRVIAPPTLLFLTPDGAEIHGSRIVGETKAEDFLQHLRSVTAG